MRRSWNRVLEVALSGVLAGLLAAGPALAQQPAPRLQPRTPSAVAAPKLTVVVVPLDPPAMAQAPRLMYQAEQAVVGAGRFELVRLADALDAQGTREREAKAEEAAAAFQEGLKAYDELDTQKALAQFDKAAQLYESSDLSRHFDDMSRARVMKIASYVANGDKKGFTRELKEVLARNPRAEFSSNYFPADELAVIERTRKGILAEATKTLQVRTGEVIAQIYVDGQFRGASPQTLTGLTPSEHFVTALAPGHAPTQGKFRGEASLTLPPVPAAARLKAWMDRMAESPDGEDRDAALRELGTLAGTQQVLALVVRGAPGAGPQDAIAIRLDVSDGHNLGYAAAPVPFGGEAMEAGIRPLLTGVLQTDSPRKGGPTTHYPSSKSGSGRRIAGYALLGAGAALVAGGVYFGLQASSKADEFKKTAQTAPLAGKLRSDGQTFALIADIGVIAGLVSAGTGTWLAFGRGDGGGKDKAGPGRPAASSPPGGEPAPGAGDRPGAGSDAQGKPSAKTREEQERRAREEAVRREEQERRTLEEFQRIKREEDERLKREEEEEKRKREEQERRAREDQARLKREEEAQRKREEEERKKRPPLDEDDLRNY